MNYEKKYNNALEWARQVMNGEIGFIRKEVEEIFPELKESKDERMRKNLYKCLRYYVPDDIAEEYIEWLEKQRDYDRLIEEMKKRKELLSKEKEKATSTNDKLSLGGRIAMLQELLAFNICNTTDNDEPKFKVGDWIVDDEIPNDVFCVIEVLGEIYKVIDIDGDDYHIPHYKVDKQFHLWTIQDAKDGDVLINWNNTTFIFKAIEDKTVKYHIAYNEKLNTIKTPLTKLSHQGLAEPQFEFHPATKEQRDLLFQKMKEAGYEWNDEKKELTKIEDKTLDADEVIEWIDEHVPTKFEDMQNYVKNFKQHFEIC